VWAALGDEFMGLTEHRCKTGVFAMITHGIIGENSLERALKKGIKFYSLVTDDITMALDFDGNDATFRVVFARPDLDPQQYFLEFWLSIWYRLTSWMGGALAPLKQATFAYPRPETRIEEFKYMFPCVHKFDADENTLVFQRSFLQLPITRTKQELKQLLSAAPLGFMTIPSDATSYGRQIRNLLLPRRRQPLEFPNFSEIASQINMVEQTLRRKLKQESTSYRSIKENIRRDIAIDKLVNGNLPISSISELLGYSETRAFTRAFHHWTGMSPMQYRESFRWNYLCDLVRDR
jgi:AraC-like DNA-binding protein